MKTHLIVSGVSLAFLLSIESIGPAYSSCDTSPPKFAAIAGFQKLTFSTDFAKSSIVMDFRATARGDWYKTNFFGHLPSDEQIKTSPQEVEILGSKSNRNSQIASAIPSGVNGQFLGTAFGGGGFFEVEMRLETPDVHNDKDSGWPAIWMLPIEGLFKAGGQPTDYLYKSRPNYRRNVEVDIFEHMFNKSTNQFAHGIAMHDWHGVYNVTCKAMCNVTNKIDASTVTSGIDYSQYHKFGFLWIPAKGTTPGSGIFYFDRQIIGRSTPWMLWSEEQSVPPEGSNVYDAIDVLHMTLIVGTGIDQPVSVRCANVWQIDDNANIHGYR